MHASWVGATGTQIARAVRRGDTTATAVVADHLDHARVADRVLDVLRVLRDSEAIAEAEQVDEVPELGNLALAGVPVLVKENTPVAGLPTWHGSAAARTEVAQRDHEVVRRLRGAGAVVLGVSRMSELGLWSTTDDASAVTRNPWRSDRTPGGSSGGSAAAVAAGVAPIAHGTDGLGCIRIPAACCGLVGLKPGRGMLPQGPGMGVHHGVADRSGMTGWSGLAEHGILATTVADAAVGFYVLAGRDLGPLPDIDPLPDIGRLRIAVSLRSPVRGLRPDLQTRGAVARAARLLVGLGHDAVAAEPRYPVGLARMAAATWMAVARDEAKTADQRHLQPRTRWHVGLGARALRLGLAGEGERSDWRDRCVSWLRGAGVDVLVTPTVAGPPPVAQPARAPRPDAGWSTRPWWPNAATGLRLGAYTAAWSLAGLPAMSVPMGVRADGLPASVQLVGPPGAEPVLLAVAAQLEQAAPWRPHAPTWPRVGSGCPGFRAYLRGRRNVAASALAPVR